MAKLILSARVDDGAIFYLNGVELQRTHLPDGPLDQSSRANSRTKSEKKFTTFILPVDQLKQGHNILSASVYQFEKKSTDMFFNTRLLLLEWLLFTYEVTMLLVTSHEEQFPSVL